MKWWCVSPEEASVGRARSDRSLLLRKHADLHPETKLPTAIRLELTLPPGFPAKYRDTVVQAADSCKVKKTVAMAAPVVVTIAETAAVTLLSI